MLTDCASLYDTIHKDGAFKLPAERRLVLDLIGYRQDLQLEIHSLVVGPAERSRLPLAWLPTSFMLADCLTKRMDGSALRTALQRGEIEFKHQTPSDQEVRDSEHVANLSEWILSWVSVFGKPFI